MEKLDIIEKLATIFRTVFKKESLIITEDLTANDVEGWDSLTHMLLIAEIENVFSIKFKLKELNKMKNVGDMVAIISSKL
ncbi:MAG: acyl carrier protein [Bacteroidales bacterium]|nr:acyl carrier protein [Bacteroidales bacterium]